MRIFIFLFLSLHVTFASASTFVGNGGNAGDVELEVAKKEIHKTLQYIDEHKTNPALRLCECYEDYEDHPVCNTLEKLTKPQVEYCAKFLKDNASALAKILRRAQMTWSRDSIEVQEKQHLRASDAVAIAKDNLIIVNNERFLAMRDFERMFLLTHELGHLLKSNGENIEDTKPVGPFTSPNGGREMLNAVAATVVMEGLGLRILKSYEPALKRSRAYKARWIEFEADGVRGEDSTLVVSSKSGGTLGLRYQFENLLGLALTYRTARGQASFIDGGVRVDESNTAWGALVTYRLSPFQDPLSFLGQSHFVFGLGAESLSAKYTLSDEFLETSATASSTGLVGQVIYNMPLQSGFWIYLKLGYLGHQYKFNIPNRELEIKPQTLTGLGVSYGF